MKQYLMLCDERSMAVLQQTFRPECVQFLEVQGMDTGPGTAFHMLVTPVIPPVPLAARAILDVPTPPSEECVDSAS